MPIILQVNYTPGPGQAAQTEAERLASARRIADLAGLAWKVWMHDPATGTRGGIYLFSDRESALSWGERQLRPRLEDGGASDILIRAFEVAEAPSEITRAPLEAVFEPA
jgi:hypothetical protein